MNLKEILVGGGVVALLSLIQIAPIKLAPWTFLAKLAKAGLRLLGRSINSELMEEVSSIKQEVSDLKTDVAGVQEKMDEISSSTGEQAAISARARILRFGDEVLHNIKHTKDHFDSVLRDAKMYGRYCASHPDFENGVTEPTIERIKAVYAERLEKNDFL